ncbi:MAG: transposase [Calditrichaceae bacterium]|nr:transposase [Calditrichaceae bacterium]MBN2709280.1 transposase [Calditrichaceae bacterium]RQV91976.1 MAG: transposase [Calditrichota bacterium]
MKYDPQKRHRRSIRLPEWDYSQAGGYYVTIVTRNRECLFGDIVDGKMLLNEYGLIAKTVWNDLPNHYDHIKLDEYVIMPNHVHGIIMIMENDGSVEAIHESPLHKSPRRRLPMQRRKMTLPKIIGRFKMNTAKHINIMRNSPDVPVWQRNYWEHIIRDENELNRIRQYIVNNPSQWERENKKNKRAQ